MTSTLEPRRANPGADLHQPAVTVQNPRASTLEPRVTLRPSEFCKRYGVSRYWLDARIKDGTIRATQVRGSWFIDAAHADTVFFGPQTATPTNPPRD